jgi:Tfp pilus assembly protein PilF
LDQAITQYEWVVSQSKNKQLLEDAWLSLAQLYTLTEKVHQAHSAWESALKINPANAGAQKAMR